MSWSELESVPLCDTSSQLLGFLRKFFAQSQRDEMFIDHMVTKIFLKLRGSDMLLTIRGDSGKFRSYRARSLVLVAASTNIRLLRSLGR